MENLPPVFDFSADAAGFEQHMREQMAKPCPHCERIALVLDIPGTDPGSVLKMCTGCGQRRAVLYPTG